MGTQGRHLLHVSTCIQNVLCVTMYVSTIQTGLVPRRCPVSAVLETVGDTGGMLGTFLGQLGHTGQTHPCFPHVSKMCPMCPHMSIYTFQNSLHSQLVGTHSLILQHIGARFSKLPYGRHSFCLFVVRGGVMADPDGATLRTISFSICSGTFSLLIMIGLRVTLGQIECIVGTRSSE